MAKAGAYRPGSVVIMTQSEMVASERNLIIAATAKTIPSTVILKIHHLAIMCGLATGTPRKVKNALIAEITTIIVRRNFQVDFASLNGIFAYRYSRIDATKGKIRNRISRNATSQKMNSINSRNLERGSSL